MGCHTSVVSANVQHIAQREESAMGFEEGLFVGISAELHSVSHISLYEVAERLRVVIIPVISP